MLLTIHSLTVGSVCDWRVVVGSTGKKSRAVLLEAPVCCRLWMHLSLCVWDVWTVGLSLPLSSWHPHRHWYSQSLTPVISLNDWHHVLWVVCCHISITTLCSEKNHSLTFSFISHEWCVDLNKNCSQYTQGTVHSTFPWVYSLQFLFKSTHHSWDMKENVSVFFFRTQWYNWNL